jgi:hypothetical protein
MRLGTFLALLVSVVLLAASPASAKLPKRLTTPTGNFITLYAFDGPSSKHAVASADVEICTSAHTPRVTEAYPPFFTLSLTNGSSVHISANTAKSPALHVTPLGPKKCVRGWISFAVPAGAHVSALVYTYGKPIRWKLG